MTEILFERTKKSPIHSTKYLRGCDLNMQLQLTYYFELSFENLIPPYMQLQVYILS